MRTVYLAFENHGGSVEHYYHFFFGCLVPLCSYLRASRRARGDAHLLARSCGPMDRILRELDIQRLELVEKRVHRRLSTAARLDPASRIVELTGTDFGRDHREYDHGMIARARRYILRQCRQRIDARREALHRTWLPDWPRILVVDRGNPDPFYATRGSERRGAGIERRRVSNHDEIVARLRGVFPSTRSRRLERVPLAEQIALFEAADVVIGQHGAALSNVVWMRRGRAVVEINPRINGRSRDHFERLATGLGLTYHQVVQRDAFAEVSPERVLAATRLALEGQPPPGPRRRLRGHRPIPPPAAKAVDRSGTG